MKKAKLILATLAILAVVGGTLAFKASRTVNKLHYRTNAITSLGTIYTAPASYCISTTAGVFWTNVLEAGVTTSTGYYTFLPPAGAVTFRQVGATTNFITVPNYTSCGLTTTLTTTIQ